MSYSNANLGKANLGLTNLGATGTTDLVLAGISTIPSSTSVFSPALVQQGIPITGTVTIPSTKQVFTGGVLSGIPSSLSYLTTGQWSGRGMARMVDKPANQWDEILDREKRIAAAVVQALVEEGDMADQRGLGGHAAATPRQEPPLAASRTLPERPQALFGAASILRPPSRNPRARAASPAGLP